MNATVTTRRFLPWLCVTQGIAWVSWYDRRFSTTAAPDRTTFFANFATQTATTLTRGTELNVAGVNDPECASGWPCSADAFSDATGCPAGTAALTGRCLTAAGGGSGTACGPGTHVNCAAVPNGR